MNTWEIDEVADRYKTHPVLARPSRLLAEFRDIVNQRSDGWAYWAPASRAAAKLCALLKDPYNPGHHAADISEAAIKKAIAPIKSLCTRKGLPFPDVDAIEINGSEYGSIKAAVDAIVREVAVGIGDRYYVITEKELERLQCRGVDVTTFHRHATEHGERVVSVPCD